MFKKVLFLIMIVIFHLSYIHSEEINMDVGFDIEEVAGFTDYSIDFGLKNFVADAYLPVIYGEIILPLLEKFKLSLVYFIRDSMPGYSKLQNNNGSIKYQKWNEIDNILDIYGGIPLNEIVDLSLKLGGGSSYDLYEVTTDTDPNKATYGYSKFESIDGSGILNFGFGILVKPKSFKFAIRQDFSFAISGNGQYPLVKDISKNIPQLNFELLPGNTKIIDNNWVKNEYFGFKYTGTFAPAIPFEIGLPLFELGLDLSYYIDFAYYYKNATKNGDITIKNFDESPFALAGGFDFNIKLGLNPSEFSENNFWITPGFHTTYYSATKKDFKKVEAGSYCFSLDVGADWKVTFAKIVWLKLDAIWRFKYIYGYLSDKNNDKYNEFVYGAEPGVVNITNIVDPGITLGFNFDTWNAEFKWDPNLNFTVTSSADTNIFNLANWEFAVSCSFPPPAKLNKKNIIKDNKNKIDTNINKDQPKTE